MLVVVALLIVTSFSEIATLKMLASKDTFSEFEANTSEAKLRGSFEVELSEISICWRFFQYRRLPPSVSFAYRKFLSSLFFAYLSTRFVHSQIAPRRESKQSKWMLRVHLFFLIELLLVHCL